MRPFSEASERNREPILAVLKRVFADSRKVLEIGSGTGQHAACFSAALPHLAWQASDVAEHLAGIRMWGVEPIELDVDKPWPALDADAVFSANTAHIMSWPQVERMFAGIASMRSVKVFCLYGPFSYGGKHTSESNARFDAMLRARDPASGVRDFDDVAVLAQRCGMVVDEDNPMPANNRLLVFGTAARQPGNRGIVGSGWASPLSRRNRGSNPRASEHLPHVPLRRMQQPACLLLAARLPHEAAPDDYLIGST